MVSSQEAAPPLAVRTFARGPNARMEGIVAVRDGPAFGMAHALTPAWLSAQSSAFASSKSQNDQPRRVLRETVLPRNISG